MIVICENCGKEVYKKPSDIMEHTYCSSRCVGMHRRNNIEYKEKLKDRRTKPRKLNQYFVDREVTKVITHDGKEILIDTEDIEKIKKFTWRINNKGYAVTEYRELTNKTKRISMHRLLKNAPEDIMVDHINRTKLDNRKSNLRYCTASQNAMNVEKYRGITSKVKGVHYDKRDKLWIAKITKNKVTKKKGFKNEGEAIKQRHEWEEKYFGEFRVKNDYGKRRE